MPPKIPLVQNFDELEDVINNEVTETWPVTTPSGGTLDLLTEAEAEFYQHICESYQNDNKFTNISDLLELDRVLSLEVMCYRQQSWLLKDSDYWGNPLSKDAQKNVQLLSKEIRDIKSGLGIDKKTRDAGKGDTIAALFDNIRLRAEEFGIHRNEQLYWCWRNWNGLEAMITAHRNSTDVERTEFGYHIKDILAWCDERFVELHELDEEFMEQQRIWIRSIN